MIDVSRALRASTPRRRAFTLVELLVVVAIIAILIAIMVPVISQARESSRTAVCANNMKEIANAVAVFADANDGRGPGSAHHTSPTSSSHSWADILDAEVFGRRGADYAIVRMSAKGNSRTLSCPNFEGGSSRRPYGLNGSLTGRDTLRDDPYRHISHYDSKGNAVVFQGAGCSYTLGAKLVSFAPTRILLGEKHSGNDNVGGDNHNCTLNRDAATPDPNQPGYACYKPGPPVRIGDYVLRHPYYGKSQVVKFDSSVELLTLSEVVESKRY